MSYATLLNKRYLKDLLPQYITKTEGIFEQVDLMNDLRENKESEDMKAIILKRVVKEIVALRMKKIM